MTDDTRDIAIETRSEVRTLTRKVEGMDEKLTSLLERAQRQDGAVLLGKAAVAAIGALGGAAVALFFKILPFTSGMPK